MVHASFHSSSFLPHLLTLPYLTFQPPSSHLSSLLFVFPSSLLPSVFSSFLNLYFLSSSLLSSLLSPGGPGTAHVGGREERTIPHLIVAGLPLGTAMHCFLLLSVVDGTRKGFHAGQSGRVVRACGWSIMGNGAYIGQ